MAKRLSELLFGIVFFTFIILACCQENEAVLPAQGVLSPAPPGPDPSAPPRPGAVLERNTAHRFVKRAGPLRLGGERLFDPEFLPLIAGKRVAIMANQTSKATVDRLIDGKAAALAAVFAPEHGFWGAQAAGVPVPDAVYRGIPVHARYGGGDDTRRIPPELLKDIDVLLFELQDLGTRHYTFISSMYLAMDSAADAGIAFVVLDRPVAVNGADVEAPLLDPDLQTFVGVGRLPNRYAMTVGELALLFKHEAALMDGPRYPRRTETDAYFNVKDLRLTVVPMSGYDRTRFWDELIGAGKWIPPSPNIPSVDSALCYVGAGLFDGNTLGEMVDGYEQFTFISLPFIGSREELEAFIAAARTHYDFPGVNLAPVTSYRTKRPNVIQFEVTDRRRFRPTYAALALLYTQAREHPDKPFFTSDAGRRSFSIIQGSRWLGELFEKPGTLPAFGAILARLEQEAAEFRVIRENYLLY